MTQFHSVVTSFAFLTTVSEALRIYRINISFVSKQGRISLTAFLLFVVMMFRMSDQVTVGLLLIVLPFFTWSMYRWRQSFNDLYVFIRTRS